MEIQLKDWILDFKQKKGVYPIKNQIKSKALELTEFKDVFKASKGWFEKFMARQFPELIDKTKKRMRKRYVVLPSGKRLAESTDNGDRVQMRVRVDNTMLENDSVVERIAKEVDIKKTSKEKNG